MSRKDLTEKRRNQILDAYEYCVLEYGLSNTTIKKIAQRAQVNKGIIHHYIGNKRDLAIAWIERLADFNIGDIQNYLQEKKLDMSHNAFVDYAFDELARSGPQNDLMIDALIAGSAQDATIQKLLFETYATWVELLTDELMKLYPDTAREKRHLVAYAIMSMAYGSSIMISLGFDRSIIPEIRSLAMTILNTLEDTS